MTALDIAALAELRKLMARLAELDDDATKISEAMLVALQLEEKAIDALPALLDAAEAMAGVRAGTHWIAPMEPTGPMYGAGGFELFKRDIAQTDPRVAVGLIYRAMRDQALSASPLLPAAKEER
jgi:hypothetical protein